MFDSYEANPARGSFALSYLNTKPGLGFWIGTGTICCVTTGQLMKFPILLLADFAAVRRGLFLL